jgi:hypothetical protein
MSNTAIRPQVRSALTPAAVERARRLTWPTAAGVVVAGSALTVWGAHDLREILLVLAVLAGTVGGVYGWLIPARLRAGQVATPALVLSVAGLALVVPAFWSAVPLALGAAGALLGQAGRTSPSGSGRSIAAVGIGALAVVGYFATYAAEAIGV